MLSLMHMGEHMRVLTKLILLIPILSACGQGPKSSGSDDPGAEPEAQQPIDEQKEEDQAPVPMQTARLVADASKLPACDAANEGALVYVKATSQFQACAAGAWSAVAIKGEKGEAGAKGDAGAAGTDGQSTHMAHKYECSGEVGGNQDVWYRLSVADMSNGDVFIYGQVETRSQQFSTTRFFSGDQQGSDEPSVIITADMVGTANLGYWTVLLDRTDAHINVTYFDLDVPGTHKDEYTQPASECQKYDF